MLIYIENLIFSSLLFIELFIELYEIFLLQMMKII